MNEKKIGDYTYDLNIIGKGSFSTVYLGYKENKKYAIKKIYRKNEEKYIKLVEKEIEIMEKLNHKNIVKLYDKYYTDHNIFLVMELCDTDLYKYILKTELNESDIKNIMKQIIEVLKYIMDKNIVHRDLKPQNILINNDKIIKLADFGFAKEFKDTLLTETICGSPLYMAPELLNNENYNIKSDLWSLGIILYQMVMKNHPYQARNIKELTSIINNKKPLILNDNINKNCRKLIEKLLVIDYKDRLDWDDLYKNKWIYEEEENEEELEDIKKEKLKKNIMEVIHKEDSFDYCFDNSIILEEEKESENSIIYDNSIIYNNINLNKIIKHNYLLSL